MCITRIPGAERGETVLAKKCPELTDPAVGVKNTEGHCSTRTQAGSIQNAKEKPDESSTQSSKEQKQEFVTDFSAERLETRRWCRVTFQGRKCTQSWISMSSDIDLRREDRMERRLNHQARLLSSGTRVEFPAHVWWLRTTWDSSSGDPILLFECGPPWAPHSHAPHTYT